MPLPSDEDIATEEERQHLAAQTPPIDADETDADGEVIPLGDDSE